MSKPDSLGTATAATPDDAWPKAQLLRREQSPPEPFLTDALGDVLTETRFLGRFRPRQNHVGTVMVFSWPSAFLIADQPEQFAAAPDGAN